MPRKQADQLLSASPKRWTGESVGVAASVRGNTSRILDENELSLNFSGRLGSRAGRTLGRCRRHRIDPEGNLESGRLRNLAYLSAAFLKTQRALELVVARLQSGSREDPSFGSEAPRIDRQGFAKFEESDSAPLICRTCRLDDCRMKTGIDSCQVALVALRSRVQQAVNFNLRHVVDEKPDERIAPH